MKKKYIVGIMLMLSISVTGIAKEKSQLKGQLGLRIPAIGIAVDALYDARLDKITPGYRILNIIMVNDSPQKIFFDPKKDHWKINDALGKSHIAITSLKTEKKGIWESLKPEIQQNMEYPLAVANGEKAIFSIFFRDDVDLREFRSISFYSSYLKKVLTYYSEGIAFEQAEPKS